MSSKKCYKEVEISEISKDVKYLIKLVEGNGKKGLVDKVEANTRWRYIVSGGLALLGVITGWLITISVKLIK